MARPQMLSPLSANGSDGGMARGRRLSVTVQNGSREETTVTMDVHDLIARSRKFLGKRRDLPPSPSSAMLSSPPPRPSHGASELFAYE
eukprot:EC786399.1.p4 GENE.EC786399.1~~EC786399.1.p4  ORF type:complete len:88 (+),score=12.38 EC786399.1:108-371(+)